MPFMGCSCAYRFASFQIFFMLASGMALSQPELNLLLA